MARFHFLVKVVATIAVLSLIRAQEEQGYNDYGEYADYQDYNNDYPQEDSLYYDYAEREQQKSRFCESLWHFIEEREKGSYSIRFLRGSLWYSVDSSS